MSLVQVQAMTDDELRIKVAELCGWERGPQENIELQNFGIIAYKMSCWHPKSRWAGWQDLPPDYPHDLNAMHDAEATMTREQQRKYTKILHPRHITNLSGDWCILHATARQRAEAFVLVMEKE